MNNRKEDLRADLIASNTDESGIEIYCDLYQKIYSGSYNGDLVELKGTDYHHANYIFQLGYLQKVLIPIVSKTDGLWKGNSVYFQVIDRSE